MTATTAKSNWKLSEFVAHGSNVNCLSLSPSNGHMLATGGDDRKINLWLVGKPNNILNISGMTTPVHSVAFNYSENWLGAGSKSGVFKVFDLETSRTVRSLAGHKAAITTLDFHRYGDIIGTGSMDTNLKLWDVRRKGSIFTYQGHTEAIRDIQFSPDGLWVVSASSDCTVKVWDLSAGKLLGDFNTHSKGVTSIQLHPREFLLASGSADRTVKFCNLDPFTVVGETSPEASGVRKVLFHTKEDVLFTGTEDALKIYGWEPVRTYDMLPIHWGKLEDMTIYGDQLIAASYAQTNVSLWCVDLKQLRPFSGDTTTMPSEPALTSDPQPAAMAAASSTRRRLFEYKRQEIPSSSPPPGGVAVNGSGGGGESEKPTSIVSNEEEGSPPSQLKEMERKELFAARQKLIRTPPKIDQPIFSPPSGADSPPTLPSPSHQSKLNQVQYIPNFSHPEPVGGRGNGGAQPNIPPPKPAGDLSQQQGGGGAGGQRRLHHPDDPVGVGLRPAQSDNPVAPLNHHHHHSHHRDAEQPKVLAKDFVPPVSSSSVSVPSSRSRVGEITTNHVDVCQILKSRLKSLQEIRAKWTVNDPKVSLELAVNSNNLSVLVDVLSLLHLKRTLWTLDMALIVLPELKLLIRSKYSVYVSCGCNIIKLILKSFGPVIKSNISSPPHGDRDLQRDLRYEKCQTCHAHLQSLREEATSIVRESSTSPAGRLIRERALMAAFAALD